MKPDISIMIITYNRQDRLKRLVNNIINTLDGLNFEIVISDNSDITSDAYFDSLNDKRINYYKNPINVGATKNGLFGIMRCRADIIKAICDDDDIGARDFYEQSIRLISSGNADCVFGRWATRQGYDGEVEIDMAYFEPFYTADAYLKNWIYFTNHSSQAAFIFKREHFLKFYMEYATDKYIDTTMEFAVHYKFIKSCNKIAFVDSIAYIWTKYHQGSIGSDMRSDMLKYFMSVFAFPISVFNSKEQYDIEFFNAYCKYWSEAAISNLYLSRQSDYFARVVFWLQNQSFNNIIIYGKGEVGLFLKDYLFQCNIEVKNFIDDSIVADDVVTYECFMRSIDLLKRYVVIIATFKSGIDRKILKHITHKENIVYLSLLDFTE